MQVPLATISYLTDIRLKDLQLAVIGKDPFPSEPTGIPFCKPTWDQQLAHNCSGRYVLLSIGLEPTAIQDSYATPSLLFQSLRSAGIVFLNASYEYVGGSLAKMRHLAFLQNGYKLNKTIINSAETVIYCGEASKIRWVAPIDRQGSHCVVHPDIRNKNSPRTSSSWHEWWDTGALHNSLDLALPIGTSPRNERD